MPTYRVSELRDYRAEFKKQLGIEINAPSHWGSYEEAHNPTQQQLMAAHSKGRVAPDNVFVTQAEEQEIDRIEQETQSKLSDSNAKSLFAKMKQLRDVRMPICKACENYRPLLKQCKLCQCMMPLKTSFEYFHCPIDKW
jgi:hypothetical protein